MQFFPTSEGYVRATDVNGTIAYSYVYNYTDPLGNIRLSYAQDPENPNVLKILEETHYYPFGLKHTNYNSDLLVHKKYRSALGIKELGPFEPLVPVLPYNYKYDGKEWQHEMELNLYDYGARNYDPAIGRWKNVDNMAEKFHFSSPYVYTNNSPIVNIDIDGNEWFYYSADGKSDPTWNWHDGHTYNTKIKDNDGKDIILTGTEAVVVFKGSRSETLGEKGNKKGFIDGNGTILASVIVYGPDGPKDIHKYDGYTMGSDPKKFGAIDEGIYNGNYDSMGKSGSLKSNWALEKRGNVRTLDGQTNPFAPNQIDSNGEGYKNGIFIHTTNQNGYAEPINNGKSGISVGCLLISPKDWNNFNNVMSGVKNFKVQVIRTVQFGGWFSRYQYTKKD